jgi:hypothetical protein
MRTKLDVKAPNGGQLIVGFIDCVARLDFVSYHFVRRFVLLALMSKLKTPVRLANGQHMTCCEVCEITFELAKHEFKRTFRLR